LKFDSIRIRKIAVYYLSAPNVSLLWKIIINKKGKEFDIIDVCELYNRKEFKEGLGRVY